MSCTGLNLLLYLEDHERIVGLGRGRGVRFTLNSFNTMPLVEDHGFSAMPGYETFVGMKMVRGADLNRSRA
jgi:hypothetical protein